MLHQHLDPRPRHLRLLYDLRTILTLALILTLTLALILGPPLQRPGDSVPLPTKGKKSAQGRRGAFEGVA